MVEERLCERLCSIQKELLKKKTSLEVFCLCYCLQIH